MRNLHYILDGHEPVPANIENWARWINRSGRTVAKTEVRGAHISTVFLGLDHNFGDGPPLLFETLVFDGTLAGEMERYTTWDKAEQGHARMVERVREVDG